MSLLVLFQGGGGSPPPEITGTLAATETGADAASLSGDVVVQGGLSAAESGSDTFAASGVLTSGIAGTFAATETGTDTAAASGDVFISGTLSANEAGSDTASFAGDVFVSGALAASEVGADTAAASGDVVVAGSLSAVEVGQDAATLSGALLVQGDLSVTESGEDLLAAFGPPSQSNEIEPIGGAFNIPTRQQMAEMARKQRIALGILPKPIQKKAKAAAKKIAQIVATGGAETEVKAALKVIPKAQRVEAMSAVQVAFAYYLAIQQKTQAQQEIARIQESQRRIAEILAEIERVSIIQREEDDIAFMLMQVIMAE